MSKCPRSFNTDLDSCPWFILLIRHNLTCQSTWVSTDYLPLESLSQHGWPPTRTSPATLNHLPPSIDLLNTDVLMIYLQQGHFWQHILSTDPAPTKIPPIASARSNQSPFPPQVLRSQPSSFCYPLSSSLLQATLHPVPVPIGQPSATASIHGNEMGLENRFKVPK